MAMPPGERGKRLVVNVQAASETESLGLRNVASAAGKPGFEKVATYRLYCLDGVGKVASAEWIEAEDDESALEAADRVHGGRACELWQNSRLVARLGGSGQSGG
jgi:hypothetical protein